MKINYNPNFLPEYQPGSFQPLQDIVDQMKSAKYEAIYKEPVAEKAIPNEKEYRSLYERLNNTSFSNGEAFCFTWDMDRLAEQPVESLRSWQDAYTAYRKKEYVPVNTQTDFLESTFFLLCCLRPKYRDGGINPWEDHLLLKESFENMREAFWLYRQAYSPLTSHGNSDDMKRRSISSIDIYSYKMADNVQWSAYPNNAHILMDKAKHLIRSYFQENKIDTNILDDVEIAEAFDRIEDLLCNNAYISFFFPFICTKMFLMLFCLDFGIGENAFIDDLLSFNSINRTFMKHHVSEAFLLPEEFDTLISFMCDILAETDNYENLCAKNYEKTNIFVSIPPCFREARIDCNWLALYLYGQGHYFDAEDFPFQYSQLILPRLISHLFKDDNGEYDLDFEWIYRDFPETDMSFTKTLRDALEKCQIDDLIRERDNEGILVDPFDNMLWVDGRFIPKRNSQKLIARTVNQAIEEYIKIVNANKKKSTDAINVFRLYCAKVLLSPVYDSCRDAISIFSSVKQICLINSSVFFDGEAGRYKG